MNRKRSVALFCTIAFTAGTLAGCTSNGAPAKEESAGADNTPLEVTIATPQVGEAPKKGSDIEQAMEKYTNAKIDIQWIPDAAFEDKKNIMIASSEMPKAFKVKANASTLNAIQSGLFWEIGPLLKDYKNLSELSPMYYDNIKVDGKLYGLPLYRDIGRAGIVYRKDWFDALGLKPPVTLDDWYNVAKAMAEKDPDKNGQPDTYGFFLDKNYNDPVQSNSFMTRLSVPNGAPNKWGVENGKIVAEFMTKPYMDTMKLLRRMFQEKLINQDFSIVQTADSDNKWNAGKVGIRVNTVVTASATSFDNVSKSTPNAVVDVVPFTGPNGLKIPAETGNNGFYLFPKSSVKTEAELKRLLGFFNKLLDADMSTLLTRGIEGKHFTKTADGKAQFKDLTLFNLEVKPYRDSLPSFETTGKGIPLKQNELQAKGSKIAAENLQSVVPNVALTFNSVTYTEKGVELDNMIRDAQTKYIMGKIDDAGWQAELDKWLKAGGQKVIDEYTAEYAKTNK
ncbi:extracellular solute-binding protein [Paenibacillus aestuarii]|uniref:Extracellular solute-binding protein n=1 Tax=Paenibacillus aestuarii TaxID=516965 RepID=A0ABW0K985_9BACL|nr:extracellular solute-binding protein [Paenibacillus aestuarii]